MRALILGLCLLAAPAWADPPRVYGDDGEYLGRLTENPYDPEGVRNPYGWYGNPYSGALVNPYSEYRNPYWSDSVENPYAPWGDDGD